ncbi:MAG: hypothetical protein ACKVW3_04165 [Phycisphaerales bacterium]
MTPHASSAPPPRTPPRKPRHRSGFRGGLLASVLLSGAFLALIVWFIWQDATSRDRTVARDGIRAQPVPKITGRETVVEPIVSDATDVRIDIMDRDEPARQAGLLRFDRMEPLEARHYAVTRPQATFFVKGAQTVVVTADEGRLYMPGGPSKEPESGRLTGNVTIRVFELRDDGERADPDLDTPSLTFKTTSLAFDSALREVTTPDRFNVTTNDAEAQGLGLRLAFNQLSKRLERGEIREGGSVTFRPRTDSTRAATSAPSATPPTPRPASASTQTTPRPKRLSVESLYRIVLTDAVALASGPRHATADSLTIWARLIDQKLPPNALGPVRIAASPVKPAPTSSSGAGNSAHDESLAFEEPAANSPTSDATASRDPTPPTDEADPFTITWKGPCTILPLDAAPAELAGQDLSLRFTAEKTGLVHLEDRESNGKGHAAAVEYAATSRRLVLAGLGPASAMLEAEGQGKVQAIRIEADLATGVVHVPGPVLLTSQQGSDAVEISATEQSDFTFRLDQGELTRQLSQAIFQGDVRAKDASGTATSGFASAEFLPDDNGRATIHRLILQDKINIDSDSSGTLAADDRVEVAFRQGRGDSPDPASLLAEGNVAAERDGMSLRADSLDASLARSPAGGLELDRAELRGDAQFTSTKDLIHAKAQTIRADLGWDSGATADASGRFDRRQRVTLLGDESVVVRHDPAKSERTTITGAQIAADGVARTLQSFGEGRFEHQAPSKASGVISTVRARWSQAMEFDDRAGTILCEGDARADSEPDTLSVDRVEAQRITLTLAPGDAADPANPLGGTSNRRLLRAEAVGSVLDREGGKPATAESRRYAADSSNPAGRVLQQLRYVEGARLLLEDEGKRLDVPGAGRLLLADRTAPAAAVPTDPSKPGTSPLASAAGSRGEALFEWAGSMSLSEATRQVTLNDRVQLVHQRLLDGLVTSATADSMIATLRAGTSVSGGPGSQGDLESAIAEGSVYVSSGPARSNAEPSPRLKELTAQRVEYDATRGILEAIASPGGLVTIVDPILGTPTSAERLTWDLVKDAVTIRRPGTVVVPR